MLSDFISLFYPSLCPSCGKNIPIQRDLLCITCQYQLPKTDFHIYKENALMERFWGRMHLQSATSLYYFGKENRVQQLIHRLKYKGQKRIGERLGLQYGETLRKSPSIPKVDLITSVPLHRRKEKKRGYNQSECFGKGLAKSMNLPFKANILKRTINTKTQTAKSNPDRFENVERAFQLFDTKDVAGKHVLLVDDVVTTGATLEACGKQILSVPGTKLSIATIAFAR